VNNDEYLAAQDQALLIANILVVTDFDAFLDRIHVSEAAGPVVDPTLFLKAQKNLGLIKTIATALRDARDQVKDPLAELQKLQREEMQEGGKV
jgi:hypothetical protein